MPDPNAVLHQGRTTLRRVAAHHAADIAANVGDTRVLQWLRDRVPNPYTLDDAHFFIREVAPKEEVFAVEHDGHFVGVVGGHFLQDVYAQNMELGYWFGVPHWGKGVASTAVALFTEHIVTACPTMVRLEACVFEGNEASARVLEKNGFEREGVRKKRVFKLGRWLDEWCYARFLRAPAPAP